MSKRKRQSKGRPPSKKEKSSSGGVASLAIPIIVGVVVVAIIIGAIIMRENQPGAAAADLSGLSVPVVTTGPRPTQAIPFPDVPRISVAETVDGMETGKVLLVDVRGGDAYDKGHAAGAVSIPENEVDARMDEIPRDVDVVFY
jgi:hypothetical protein